MSAEPEYYGDFVYEFRRIVGDIDSEILKEIVHHFKKDTLQHEYKAADYMQLMLKSLLPL